MQDFERKQIEFSSAYVDAPSVVRVGDILGLSKDFSLNNRPVNGLRHKLEAGTSGWYIYSGEYREDAGFYEASHAGHLSELAPQIIQFLGLPPGWRFLWDGDYVDVWFDENLLNDDEPDCA